ncbi:MAG: hypothetical protein ABIJ08_05115 [Nanoarchaeota archaeon]
MVNKNRGKRRKNKKTKKIEEKVEETFRDIVRDPFRVPYSEIMEDMDYSGIFKGSQLRRDSLEALSTPISIGISVLPHEMLHAAANKLTGGTNSELVINRLFLGDLWSLIPGVESKLMTPFIGGYMSAREYGSDIGRLITAVAPYSLTPIGIYLVAEAKKRKSVPLALAGSGIIMAHAGGAIGDFYNFGVKLTYMIADKAYHIFNGNFDSSNWKESVLLMGGTILGLTTASLSYRLFKAGVNYIRNNRTGNKSV